MTIIIENCSQLLDNMKINFVFFISNIETESQFQL